MKASAGRKKQPGRSSQEKAARKKQQERRDQAIAKAQAALTNAEPKHDNIVATIGAERNALEHKSQAENARWAKEKDRLERASPGARVAPGRRPLNCKEAIEPQAARLLAPDAAHTAGHSVIG